MARYDASINLLVSGQQKVEKLLSSVNGLESAIDSLKKTPLQLNLGNLSKQLGKNEKDFRSAGEKINNLYEERLKNIEKIGKLNEKIVRNEKILESGASSDKKRKAIEAIDKALNEQLDLQNKLNESIDQSNKLTKARQSIQGSQADLRALRQQVGFAKVLADSYLEYGDARKYVEGKGFAPKGTIVKNEASIAAIKQQAGTFELLANNARIASKEFNRFAIASELASIKAGKAQQEKLGALAEAFSPAGQIGIKPRFTKEELGGARGAVDALIGSYGGIVKSEAALSSYISQLQSLQSLVPYTSNEFRVLEEALAGVNQELSQVGLRGQKSALQALSGPATDLGSLKAFQLRESFQKKINDQLNRQDSIQERISQASLFDFQKKKLTLQLDEAVAALAENRLGDAQRLTREIDRQRISMERMNRAAQKPQVFGVLGTDFMPVTGEFPSGKLASGSPAAKAAEAKANRESTQAAVALARQKQKAIEDEAEELRKGTQAATALGKQKLKALQDEAERLRQETSNAVALAQQKMREEERAIAQAWKMRGGPELPPSMGGGTAGVRGQAFRAGGPGAATAALSAPRRVEALVRSTQLAQEKLTELEIRGVDISAEKASAQKILNSLKEKDLQISDQLLNSVDDELNLIRDVLRLEKQRLANQRLLDRGGSGGKTGSEGTGLQQALKKLEEARGARQAFLGDTSPAQAIDQIVREFNKGKPGGGVGANVVNTLLSEASAGVPKAAVAGEQLGKAIEDGLNDGLGIQSPSKVAIEAMLNVVNTLVNTAKSGKAKVQAALEDLVAPKLGSVQKAPLLKSLTATAEDTIEKLSNFIGRASVRPSLYRPLARLAGPELLSGGAVPQVMQRKAFEAGKILPETRLLSLSDRRLLRGSVKAPGGGLESEVLRAAIKGVSGTGAFAGPLASVVRGQGAIASRLFPALSQGPAGAGGTEIFPVRPQPRIGAPGSAFPFQSYRMGGAQQFPTDEAINLLQKSATRGDANKALTDAIGRYRDAVNNFWDGEDSQFEAISKVVKSSVQVGGAKLARKFTESGLGAGLSKITDIVSGEKELGVSRFVGQSTQRISDSILNALEPLAYSIGDSFKDGIDKIRNAVPGLVSRGLSVASGAIGGGGGRPPVPPASGGPTRDPEEFNRRLSAAADQGAEALLGLRELRDPAKTTTAELEALSNVLKEFRKILDPTTEGFDRLEKQLRETAANLDRQVERRAPEAGFLTRRFGPRTARGLSEGLIGGAFPLLFGQGIGAAVGGGAGGFAGGFAGGGLGFGLSLAGTALGTAFDTAVQGATELGAALQKPVENFDKLTEKSFFSSKALENTIKKTIEYGDTATASALIQEESIKKLGVNGVQNLKILGTESDRLNRAFAELGQQMQAVAAGPLSAVTGFFANIFGQAAAAGRVRILRSNLNERQAGQFNQEILGRLQQRGVQRGFFAPSAPTEAEIGMLQQQGALQDIVDKWQAIQVKGQIKIDPKQRIESEINSLQKQLEAIDIGRSLKEQVRNTAKEQQDLDKQRFELARSYEESIAGLRKQVEDEIRSKRFAIIEKENQLLDAQGQLRLKQLQIENQAAIAQAGAGERPEIEQTAKEVAQLVAQFSEQQLSAEEEAAKIKRDAALEVQKIDSDAAQLKVNIEKEVSRLNIETARRVAEINDQVRRRNEELDSRRFTIERDIAALKLRLFQDELALATKNAALPLEARQQAFDLYEAVRKERSDVEKLKAPAPLRGVGAVGGGGVSTAGLDKAASDYRAAVENYVAAQLKLNELDVVKNAQEFSLGILELAKKTDAALMAIQTREADAEIERLRYIELINAGLTDTVAKKVIELEMAKQVALAVYDTAIAQLANKIQAGEVTAQVDAQNRAYLEQIKILKDRRDAIEGRFGAFDAGTGKGTGAIGSAMQSEPGKKIQDFIAQAKAELNDLEAVAVRVSQGIGDAVANSLANGISGLIEGTTTAKEVFAGFLKDMGNILIKEGTRMIGMYIAIGVAKMFAGLFSGAAGASKPALPGSMGQATNTGLNTGAGNISDMLSGLAADGAYFANGVAAFAKGGMFTNSVVSSPTLFKFADGGVPALGVAGEAGPEAIMPLRRSANGRLGVEASGLREAMNSSAGGGSTNAPSLNMTFETTNIGGVEYVSRDQLEAAMAATRRDAARDGAKRGMSMTLDKLQQSPGTRGRVGLR